MLNREVANLAKRKQKKATLGASLKYEIYGILLITLSVIALYGEAAGGRSLSKLFGYLLGHFYFLIPLAGIWLGLYVMIKRAWPRGWTSRRTGFVLLGCGLALWSAMSFVDSRLAPLGAVTPSSIFSQTLHQLYEQIWGGPIENDVRIWQKDIGGGLAGAFQYSILYWLFGNYGSKFVLLIELAISIMLITNRSYVDMIRAIRGFIKRVIQLFAARIAAGRKPLAAKAVPVKSKSKKAVLAPVPGVMEDDLDDGEPMVRPNNKKKPVFFQLFHGEPDAAEETGRPVWEDDDPLDGPILYPAAEGPKVHFKASEREAIEEGVMSKLFGKDSAPPEPESSGVNDNRSAGHVPAADEPAAWEPHNDGAAYGDTDGPLVGGAAMEDSWHDDNEDWEQGHGLEERDPGAGLHPLGDDDLDPGLEQGLEADGALEAGGSTASAAGSSNTAAAPKPVHKPKRPYRIPPFHLLGKPQNAGKGSFAADNREIARKLEATLESFGVRAKVLDVARGPAVTRYELQPDVGVKVSRIVNLTDDIALALAAKDIRMEAPIPGKSAIGIEVPNSEVSIVTLREVLETSAFQDAQSKLSIAFGRDISGQPIVGNLARMPHLLVAGATGSGKSVCINGIIASILYKAKPDEVKFLMIDPKMVELNVYNGIPHLLAPVVTDPRRAALALKKIVVEMEKRYEKFSKSGTRNIEGYNALMMSGDNPDAVLPYYVIIVDELADLMMVAAGDVEDSIMRLAQMARAAGIHLIIATQRPSVDVITGVIKANIPSRIAFGVSSQVDSRTILDMVGAEKLLGRGDMLFLPMGASKPIRVQGAFLSDNEVEAVVNHVRGQAEAVYNEELVPEVGEEAEGDSDEMLDELFEQAVGIVIEAKQASVSLLQRRMRIGYNRAARLIDSMEARGIIGPHEGSKPREVLVTLEQYQSGQRIPS
ncbi:DNA translocase FtsK [Cohnella lubricantis]|uniref:DNA translocase FtsK n=1 Tax=Cohnella lubricantis TaxID=2163172 RepID=A0A841TL48_9BACL|nr:DNA translocase FtsK [Cohnella lubricantis]